MSVKIVYDIHAKREEIVLNEDEIFVGKNDTSSVNVGIYVSKKNGSDKNIGTNENEPVRTIRQALANLSIPPDNSIMILDSEVYDEGILVVDEYGVSIVAKKGETPTIMAGRGARKTRSEYFESDDTNTAYVKKGNVGGDGSYANPYGSIHEAITNLGTRSCVKVIDDETYEETITINGIVLEAEEGRIPVLRGVINFNSGKIVGFVVDNANITIGDDGNKLFKDCSLFKDGTLLVDDSANATTHEIRFESCVIEAGVVYYSSATTKQNLKILGCDVKCGYIQDVVNELEIVSSTIWCDTVVGTNALATVKVLSSLIYKRSPNAFPSGAPSSVVGTIFRGDEVGTDKNMSFVVPSDEALGEYRGRACFYTGVWNGRIWNSGYKYKDDVDGSGNNLGVTVGDILPAFVNYFATGIGWIANVILENGISFVNDSIGGNETITMDNCEVRCLVNQARDIRNSVVGGVIEFNDAKFRCEIENSVLENFGLGYDDLAVYVRRSILRGKLKSCSGSMYVSVRDSVVDHDDGGEYLKLNSVCLNGEKAYECEIGKALIRDDFKIMNVYRGDLVNSLGVGLASDGRDVGVYVIDWGAETKYMKEIEIGDGDLPARILIEQYGVGVENFEDMDGDVDSIVRGIRKRIVLSWDEYSNIGEDVRQKIEVMLRGVRKRGDLGRREMRLYLNEPGGLVSGTGTVIENGDGTFVITDMTKNFNDEFWVGWWVEDESGNVGKIVECGGNSLKIEAENFTVGSGVKYRIAFLKVKILDPSHSYSQAGLDVSGEVLPKTGFSIEFWEDIE